MITNRRITLAAAIGLTLAVAGGANADLVNGRVVDQNGRGVAGIEVASLWSFQPNGARAHRGAKTEDDGSFTLDVNFYNRPGALMAMNSEQTHGGLIVIDPATLDPEKPDRRAKTITLEPLVELTGDFFCEAFDRKPEWTNVYMNVMPRRIRIASFSSREAEFAFKLPPGDYQFYGYGTDVKRMTKDVTLAADEPVHDMGTVNLKPTIIAEHYGKAPPPLHVTEARDVETDVKLEDFKGTWLLIEFWGYW